MSKEKDKDRDATQEGGFGGILEGMTDLIDKLNELAKTGHELSGMREIHGANSSGKEIKGIFGYNVRIGLNKDDIHIEPFGNIRKDEKSGRAVVQEVLEPVVDIFEEPNYTSVVAELPGIGIHDVKLEVKDDVLTIRAEKGEKKYYKEILLPKPYPKGNVNIIDCNNGILEIKCINNGK